MLHKPTGLKPREERLQVFLRARMRAGTRPADVCIRNISSRGMLLQAAVPPPRGTYIEILFPRHTVVGRVVWVKERRFGVHTRESIDLKAILDEAGLGKLAGHIPAPAAAPALKTRAAIAVELRERHERSRRLSAAFEFVALAACAAVVAILAAEAIYGLLGVTAREVAAHL